MNFLDLTYSSSLLPSPSESRDATWGRGWGALRGSGLSGCKETGN